QILSFDLISRIDEFFADRSTDWSLNRRLHFHSFHHKKALAFLNMLAGFDAYARDRAWEWRTDVAGLRRISLAAARRGSFERLIANRDFARLAVQFIEDGTIAVRLRIADREELDNQNFAGFDLDGDLFSGFEAVEELRRGEHVDG